MDLLLLAALALFLLARCFPQRRYSVAVAVVAAFVALVVGVLAAVDHRWQAWVGAGAAAVYLLVAIRSARRAGGSAWGPLRPATLWLALPGALALAAIYWFPVPDLPRPSGDHPVGVRAFELVDRSRRGTLPSAPEAPRRLLVRVWYPATEVEGLERRHYFSEREAETTALSVGRLLGVPFLFQYVKHSRTWSYPDAPSRATESGARPVVVYSHGYTSFAGQNTALMEELASHGYLVFALQHTRDSAPTVFPDGDVVESDPRLMEAMSALLEPYDDYQTVRTADSVGERHAALQRYRRALRREGSPAARSARLWLRDRLFLLDRLARGAVPAPVRPLVASGDYTATGQMGMSFGGSTTAALCMRDERCAAGVNLDGADFHVLPLGEEMPVPFMMLYSDYDRAAAQATGVEGASGHGFNDFVYERYGEARARRNIHRFKINDVTHIGVSDFTLFMRNPVRDRVFGSIDAKAMLQLQNDFVRGFFDTYLRGQSVGFPESAQRRHRRWVEVDDTGAVRRWWRSTHADRASARDY